MPAGFLDSDTSGSQGASPSLVFSEEEIKLITFFRGFPDSAKKEALMEFESKFNKYNELFKELLASRS